MNQTLSTLLMQLAQYNRARSNLMNLAESDPKAVLLYLDSIALPSSDIPGGELLRDLREVATGMVADAAKGASATTTH